MNRLAKAGVVVALVAAVALVIALKGAGDQTAATSATPAATQARETPPARLPKLVDLGAGKCIPCKMMKPILDELRRQYEGRFELVFIDVTLNRDAVEQYGIRVIPTQIFYDAAGKELFRHEGFFSKEDILKTWEDHGIRFD